MVHYQIYYSAKDLPSRERTLSEREEEILFEKINDDVVFSRQIEILLYTGIRRGELFKIEWRDIDFENGFINIRKEITKTGKGREIYMFFNVQKIFESLRDEAENFSDADKIFPGAISQAGTFSQKFRVICSALGWNDLSIHSLRHTYSTRCEIHGVGAFAHKALLGHTKLSMTEKYTHISRDSLKKNLNSFEQNIAARRKNVPKDEIIESKVLKFNKYR